MQLGLYAQCVDAEVRNYRLQVGALLSLAKSGSVQVALRSG